MVFAPQGFKLLPLYTLYGAIALREGFANAHCSDLVVVAEAFARGEFPVSIAIARLRKGESDRTFCLFYR